MKLRNVKRRGQATAIGGVFFLLIAILLTNFLYEVISIQQEMNQFDSDRAQERVDISKVFFGNYAKYDMPNSLSFLSYSDKILEDKTPEERLQKSLSSIPPDDGDTYVDESSNPDPYIVAYPGTGARDPPYTRAPTDGYLKPLGNGEFTSDARGWYFTRSYSSNEVSGGSGAYTTEVTGSTSGAGAVYMDFLYNPPTGETATATLIWSRIVNIDLNSIGMDQEYYDRYLEGEEIKFSMTLSFGRKCTIYDNVLKSEMNTQIILPIKLIDPDSEDSGVRVPQDTDNSDLPNELILDTEAEWKGEKTHDYTRVLPEIIDLSKELGGRSVQCRVVIWLDVELKHSVTTIPELKMLIDDVNLEIEFTNYILDWEFSYTVTQSPNLIAEVGMVFQSHYDSDVVQGISIIDQTTLRPVPLSLSPISTADVKLKYDFSGADLQNYIHPDDNVITFKCYTVSSSPFKGVFSAPTLDILYSETQDNVIVYIRNWGGVTISIVSVWVNDYSGHNQHPQPTIDTWLDFPISPGETYKLVVPHNWKAGEVKVKIVTSKGTIVQVLTTAY